MRAGSVLTGQIRIAARRSRSGMSTRRRIRVTTRSTMKAVASTSCVSGLTSRCLRSSPS